MQNLLNHERISTQLRDWRQIAQQKAIALAGCAEATVYEAESMRYSLLLEFINQQAEQIRQMCKILETEQRAHLITKCTLMVRTEQLAAERRIYKAAWAETNALAQGPGGSSPGPAGAMG